MKSRPWSWREAGVCRAAALGAISIALAAVSSGAIAASSDPRIPSVCAQIAKLANQGALERAFLKGRSLDDAAIPVPTRLQSEKISFYDLLDIDGDGKPEWLYALSPDPSMDYERNDEVVPRAFDEHLNPVEYPAADPQFWSDSERSKVSDVHYLRLRDAIYTVARFNQQLRYAVQIGSDRMKHAVCEFATTGASAEDHSRSRRPRIVAASDYEMLMRSVRSQHMAPWEFVLSRLGTDAAETLLRNGHRIDELVGHDTLLSIAFRQDRIELVQWLLANGATVNPSRDAYGTPLDDALRANNVPVAILLLEHGADVVRGTNELLQYAQVHPQTALPLLQLAIKKLGAIPEPFVQRAVLNNQQSWLDFYVSTRLPVRVASRHWHNGQRVAVPYQSLATATLQRSPEILHALERLYAHSIEGAQITSATVSFGSFDSGVLIQRYQGDTLSDEDLVSLGAAFCRSFVNANCGGEVAARQAAAWSARRPDSCPPATANIFDTDACKVLVYLSHPDPGNAPVIFRLDRKRLMGDETIYGTNLKELTAMYQAKKAAQ